MEDSLVPRPYLKAISRSPKGIKPGQFRAAAVDEAVVFLSGMRVNRLVRVWSWLPVFRSMSKMLQQLQRSPGRGFLGARMYASGRDFLVVQYWRSAEELGAYARDHELLHLPRWRTFNRRTAGTADVGVYHETYTVPGSGIETLYSNMPTHGLGASFGLVARDRARHTRAMERMQVSEPDYTPAEG